MTKTTRGSHEMKRVEMVFERGGRFVIDLLEDHAPKTCSALLKVLPLKGLEVRHAKSSGDEVYVQAMEMVTEEENNVDPSQGDVVFNVMPNWRAICIYYGPKITNRINFNRFGKIAENLEELEEVGNRVWLQGTEKADLRLLED